LRLAALHSLGLTIAAAAVGAVLAVAALAVRGADATPSPAICWGMALLALIYVPRQLGWVRFPPLLQSTRQVPRRWAYEYPRWATALLFGVGLGNGCYTRIVTPTFYLLILWPFLAPSLLTSIVIWGSYGLARSLPVWWLACSAPVGDPFPRANGQVAALMRRIGWMRRGNALVLIVVACWLVAGSHLR
jgi:hypothetical protein